MFNYIPARIFKNGTCYGRTGYHANALDQQHQTVGTSEIIQINQTDQDAGRKRKRAGKSESKYYTHGHQSIVAGY